MKAPLTDVRAMTLSVGPALQAAVSVRPLRLRTVVGPVPAPTTNAIFSTLRPLTLLAFVALVAVGTVLSEDSTMLLPSVKIRTWPFSFSGVGWKRISPRPKRIIPVTPPTEARLQPDWDSSLAQMITFQPDIVQPADEWADDVGPCLGCQERLASGEAKRHVEADPFLAQR